MPNQNGEAPTAQTVEASDLSVTLCKETNMKSIANSDLNFHGTALIPVKDVNGVWLTSADVAKALGYKSTKSISNLFAQYEDEFSQGMTMVIESVTNGINGSSRRMKVRVFSLRGAHLIAMFARTPVAKEFRRWVLDILDREVDQSPIKRRANYNYPIETASPKRRSAANDWMTPRKMLDETNRSPDLELIKQLEKDGYDVSGVKVRIHALYEIAQEHLSTQQSLEDIRALLSRVDRDIRYMTTERGMNVTFDGSHKGSFLGNGLKILQS